jgi:hypothetical protein
VGSKKQEAGNRKQERNRKQEIETGNKKERNKNLGSKKSRV